MDSLRLHCDENSCLKSDTDAASIHLPSLKLSNKKIRTRFSSLINSLFLSVFVKSFSGFHPKLALFNKAVDEFAGSAVVGWVVVDVLVQVQSGVVQQLKGPHGVAEAQLDGHVHVLVGCIASLYHRDGILDIRTKQGIDNESRSILAGHSVLPNGLAPRRHCLIRSV